jgi:hypothetical protein
VSAAPWAAPQRARAATGAGAGPAGPAGRRPQSPGRGPRPLPPDPLRLASGFVRLFLEVEAGLRPRGHLTPFLDSMLRARLEDVWVKPGPPGLLLRMHGVPAGADCFDAVALVRRGERYGAIGVRLARVCGTWRVTDLARPEDGELPPPAYPVLGPEIDDEAVSRNTPGDGELSGSDPRNGWGA